MNIKQVQVFAAFADRVTEAVPEISPHKWLFYEESFGPRATAVVKLGTISFFANWEYNGITRIKIDSDSEFLNGRPAHAVFLELVQSALKKRNDKLFE